jgi:hypothetical protein
VIFSVDNTVVLFFWIKWWVQPKLHYNTGKILTSYSDLKLSCLWKNIYIFLDVVSYYGCLYNLQILSPSRSLMFELSGQLSDGICKTYR